MTTTDLKIFLSIVSAEFESYRVLLTQDLHGPHMDVKSQDRGFVVGGGTLLSKLDAYIAGCNAVVHLIGDATGSSPQAQEVKELLANYSDFGRKVPALADVLALGAADISYTQWEAYLALYYKKDLFIYRPEPGAPKDSAFKLDQSQQESQKRHLARLMSAGRDCTGTFVDKERLSNMVLRSFLGLGWGELFPLRTETHRLPSCDCPKLFGRDDELKMLDAAWEKETHRNVVCIVARGGLGKTALIHNWVQQMEQDGYRGAKRVFAYSFYDQGTINAQGTEDPVTSADAFFQWALDLFGGPELKHADPNAKGVGLAQLVRQQRTLLLLDGLEPLQVPPLAGIAAEVRRPPGTLKDKALLAFLKELASDNPGLCVITTRFLVADLTDFDKRNVQQIKLKPLSKKAGADLLSHRGVKGKRKELEQVSTEFGGEGLALTLLGNLLRDVYQGDVEQRSEVRNHLEEDGRGGHAWRVMDSYEKWFSQGTGAELNVLCLLGLFDRPADGEAVKSLLRPPAIPGLNNALLNLNGFQWKGVLQKLRDADLLNMADPRQPETLNTHPLVREHFSKKLRGEHPQAWQEGNIRLYEHFRNRAPDLPDTFEEVRPLFVAVPFGCEAGRHLEVFEEVYWRRILRENRYHSTDMLGLFGEDLMAASCFFDRRWDQPLDQFSEEQKAQIQRAAGWDLRSLGRMEEAIQALQGSLERYERLELWEPANVSCSQIAQIHMYRGNLRSALKYAERKQGLADKTHKTFYRTGGFVLRALILFQMGSERQDEYESYCRRVGELGFAKDEGVGDAVDHMFIAFCWCDLLLGQVASPCTPTKGVDGTRAQQVFEEIETRCDQVEEIAREEDRPHPATEAAHLLRGRAYLLRGVYGGGGEADLTQAKALLDRALALLRTGPQELYLPGLRSRAALHFFTQNLDAAEEDLREALKVAKRGEMHLYEVDCQLQFVGLYLALKKNDKARKLLAQTGALVHKLGYHRRDQDIAELAMALGADSVEASPSLAVVE